MSRTANKPDNLTREQREHLIFGYTILDGIDNFPFKSKKERKRLYFQHKDELLEATGQNRRPAAWWDFESPEKRKIIDGDPSLCMWESGLSFGKPRLLNIESWKDPNRPLFESQRAFLKRLKL